MSAVGSCCFEIARSRQQAWKPEEVKYHKSRARRCSRGSPPQRFKKDNLIGGDGAIEATMTPWVIEAELATGNDRKMIDHESRAMFEC